MALVVDGRMVVVDGSLSSLALIVVVAGVGWIIVVVGSFSIFGYVIRYT